MSSNNCLGAISWIGESSALTSCDGGVISISPDTCKACFCSEFNKANRAGSIDLDLLLAMVGCGVLRRVAQLTSTARRRGNGGFFFPQPACTGWESGSPARWARPALYAAGGGSGQRAQRAPTRGPSQARRQRRLWRPATALPGPGRQRRAALQSTACPTTCVSRQWESRDC